MKKIFLSLSATFILAISLVTGQIKSVIDSTELKNWYHQNYEKTGVYGVGTDDAIAFLKSKGLKPNPIIVGVIDSGIQIDHPDLKNNIWTNPKEKANNKKDDDKNGYIDDVHGWSFLGGKDGKDVNQDTMEATRLLVKYEKLFNGTDKATNETNKKKYPQQYNEYLAAKLIYDKEFEEAEKGMENVDSNKQQINKIVSMLKSALGNKTITEANAQSISNPDLKNYVLMLAGDEQMQGKTADEFEKIALEDFKEATKYYGNKLKYSFNKNFDPRNIVGDNYTNINERFYGNNHVEGPDAMHGTHVAGIIAAERNNNIGMDGIAGDVAKILVVRAVPDGDERDKDVANAIYYAVDNGAKIINMSFGKPFSPNKEKVWDAIKYAENKGVLMVHAAGNDNKNIDITYNYPTNYKDRENTSFVNNWINVGASTRYSEDKLKASFSNYGSRVDLFAPGLEIYSTVTKGKYKFLQGTSMASPVVAGCAALLWAYFPGLTNVEVKDILMKTVNKSYAPLFLGDNAYTTFDKLSKSGGVIDVYKAVKYAYENYPSKIKK